MSYNEELVVSVVYEEQFKRSSAYVGNKLIGVCEYENSGKKWTIIHTGVEQEYQGRGIARRLVECVIDEARKRGIKIIPICSYANKLMGDSNEYKDLLIEGE